MELNSGMEQLNKKKAFAKFWDIFVFTKGALGIANSVIGIKYWKKIKDRK
jgi:hypothetical protein